MSRWDYDVLFYRVFCVTLLATAFAFTVILTNVFIDIDGLLTNRKTNLQEPSDIPKSFTNDDNNNRVKEAPLLIFNEDVNNDNEINPSYRTKRSIESENTFHPKNPAIKKILTRRLASLLEELDEEEATKEVKLETTTLKPVFNVNRNENDRAEAIRNEDLLHLAMHNILLQGLIGHMDLNDVYKKVHTLVNSFNNRDDKNTKDEKEKILKAIVNSKEIPGGIKHDSYNEEHKFFEELIKCKNLEDQIAKSHRMNHNKTTNRNTIDKKDGKMFIKTIIEINESTLKKLNNTNRKENIEGLIKLIYNGKPIKINQMEDDMKLIKNDMSKVTPVVEQLKNTFVIKSNKDNIESEKTELNNNRKHSPSPLLNKMIEDYLNKHSLSNYEYLQSSAEVKGIKSQRIKRQIKIRYFDNVTKTSEIKPLDSRIKKDDDDLYIEIETHFDGKGIKGEKKKKLVRNLIDKIQKALRSDIEDKRDIERIRFVKRTQDPIYSQITASAFNKIVPSFQPIEHRQLDPISKTLENHENVADRFGDAWKKQFSGPNFLSISKSVNSAEMNELNVDYDSVLKNGISKRLQKPLNTNAEDEAKDNTGLSDVNTGNVSLFLKDIDGSGFSIGFNQYVGEPPDKDSMKMFNGIENLIREYHKTYDQEDVSNESAINKLDSFVPSNHDIAKRNVENLHRVYKRSITEVNTDYYNANIHKIILKNGTPFDKYLNLFKRRNQKLKLTNKKNNIINESLRDNIDTLSSKIKISLREIPIIVDERIFNKTLKPSEIFTLANLIKRKKRSLSVKKISNLKSKIKLNRYLNTKAMANKKIFLKNKRNKRHVNNIRIITRDKQKVSHKNSDENIFFISRENSYLDKETIKGVEIADTKINNKNTEYYDEDLPYGNIYRIQSPTVETSLNENLHETIVSPNTLMSKYPHIFIDKSSNSKEETYFDEKPYINFKPYRVQAFSKPIIDKQEMETTTKLLVTVLQDIREPKVEEIVNAIMPPLSKTNYKVTVKISPKNNTSSRPGFKEVHTTVNKSFDENGVRYFSLLNVSQISKIEKLNQTDVMNNELPLSNRLKDQQKQIKTLLQLHKNRVDQQLNNLLSESNHLEKMIESNRKYNYDRTMRLLIDESNGFNKADEKKLMDSVRQLQGYDNQSKMNERNVTATPIQEKTTTEIPNFNKVKIIDTIKHNEKITLEILKKIDTNTQILKTFLSKLSEKLDSDKKLQHVTTIKSTEKSALEVKLDLSKDWKSYKTNKDAFFIPNEYKNDTIPFVYAYQQNIPVMNKTPSKALASLVYHGHIHTNRAQNMNRKDFKKPATKIESNAPVNTDNNQIKFNQSKFFLDDLDDFKVMQNKDHIISANIKINTTNV